MTDTIPATLTREEARSMLLAMGYGPEDVSADLRDPQATLAKLELMGVRERSQAILRAFIAGQAAAPSQPAANTGGLCLTHGAFDTRHGCPGCAAQPAQGASITDLSAVCQRCDPRAVRQRPTRRDLLLVIGKLQTLVGSAKAAFQNDRDPSRSAHVQGPLEQAEKLCIEARGFDPPMAQTAPNERGWP